MPFSLYIDEFKGRGTGDREKQKTLKKILKLNRELLLFYLYVLWFIQNVKSINRM